jgi:hypothetical protein
MCEKLEYIRQHLQLEPSEVAWKMTSGRFQRLKCAFGTEATLTPWLKLDVPFLGPDADFPEADIYNGQMQIAWCVKPRYLLNMDHDSHLQRDNLKKSFDLKVDEIINLVDGHIRQMHAKYPNDNIVRRTPSRNSKCILFLTRV